MTSRFPVASSGLPLVPVAATLLVAAFAAPPAPAAVHLFTAVTVGDGITEAPPTVVVGTTHAAYAAPNGQSSATASLANGRATLDAFGSGSNGIDDDSAGTGSAGASWTSIARPVPTVTDPTGIVAIMEVVATFTSSVQKANNGAAGISATLAVPALEKTDNYLEEAPSSLPADFPRRLSVTSGAGFDIFGGFLGTDTLEVELSLFAYAYGGRSGGESKANITLVDRSLPGFTAPPPALTAGDVAAAPVELSFFFYDDAGHYVNGIRMVSDTGVDYPVNGVVVPEASGLALLALAAAATPGRRRRD